MAAGGTTDGAGADDPVTGRGDAVEVLPADADRSELAELVRQWSVDALQLAGTSPTERFDRITRLAKQLLGADAAITVIDRDRQWYKSATSDRAGTDIARSDSFCDRTVQQAGTFEVPDAREDERFRDSPLVQVDGVRFYAGESLLGPGGERIGALCVWGPEPRRLGDDEQRTLRDLALWVQDELALVAETTEAVQVQQGLLPAPLRSLRGSGVAGASLPLHAVGGDFYDWYPVPGGAAFTIGGVMGRGAAAAIVAATVRATMRASSRSSGAALAVETAADTLDADLTGSSAFVTLFHGHLDEETGGLQYIDAGHGLSLIVRRDGEDEHLPSWSPPLGAAWEAVWQDRTAVLRPGDVLVSVSDGVLDAFGGSIAALGRVAAIAREERGADAVVRAVVAAAMPDAVDDVTVMAVSRDAGLEIGR